MKFYFLIICFFTKFIYSEITFLDRIAIIVDEGIIMESELNNAIENTINNFAPIKLKYKLLDEKIDIDTIVDIENRK